MALRSTRLLSRLLFKKVIRSAETPVPGFLLPATTASSSETQVRWLDQKILLGSTSTIPSGHQNSDLRDVACNIRLSRMRDISLRRDVLLYEGSTPKKLVEIFKGQRALLVGIPGGKVCCQQHLPHYLEKVHELGINMLDKIVVVYSSKDSELEKIMASTDKNKVCFYEDRDLSFARMLGLERDDGAKTQRFAAVINDGLLLRMNVETHPREVKETKYDILLDVWKQFCANS